MIYVSAVGLVSVLVGTSALSAEPPDAASLPHAQTEHALGPSLGACSQSGSISSAENEARIEGDNPVRQAVEAFGTTYGRETIGIYSPRNVRGFSALSAGNARIEGLYFDQIAGLPREIRESTAIRVGLAALDFPLPAPTGVIDYALVRPDCEQSLSVTVSASGRGSASTEVDFNVPIGGQSLAFGGGVGFSKGREVNGSTRLQSQAGLTAIFSPREAIEVQPFWARTDTYDNRIAPYLAPAGHELPQRVDRYTFYGQDWAQFKGVALIYGVRGHARILDQLQLEAGLFRSVFLTNRDTFVLISDLDQDGTGNYSIFTDPTGKTASTSGEVRLTTAIDDQVRQHRFAFSLRGRAQRKLFGGSDVRDYGRVSLDSLPEFPAPSFEFGEQSKDRVKHFNMGFSYSGSWRGIGRINLALSRADYDKQVYFPFDPDTRISEKLWLYSASSAIDLTPDLTVYVAYTRGLEDNGTAPQNAINRNQALPALVTSQRSAGFRFGGGEGIRLVGGLFEIHKPYFSLNDAGFFGELGRARTRGIEFSISGKVTRSISLVTGVVLLDPKVVGEVVTFDLAGDRQVGLPTRRIDLNLDWSTPINGFSLDMGVAHQSSVAANTLNTVSLPGRTVLHLGGRYDIRIGSVPSTLRVRVENVADRKGFELRGPGTYDLLNGRTISVRLGMEF